MSPRRVGVGAVQEISVSDKQERARFIAVERAVIADEPLARAKRYDRAGLLCIGVRDAYRHRHIGQTLAATLYRRYEELGRSPSGRVRAWMVPPKSRVLPGYQASMVLPLSLRVLAAAGRCRRSCRPG